MKKEFRTLLPVAVLVSVCALPCNASLVGTAVTGSLTFAGDPSNYFDPSYGFVPATDYLNTLGTTVTISDTAVEFGYDDGASLISADFSDTQLTVSDLSELSGQTNAFQLVFTDASFAGQLLELQSEDYPFTAYSLVGDSITLVYAGGSPTVGQTYEASFTAAQTPEPSTLSLSSTAFGAFAAICAARRRRVL